MSDRQRQAVNKIFTYSILFNCALLKLQLVGNVNTCGRVTAEPSVIVAQVQVIEVSGRDLVT